MFFLKTGLYSVFKNFNGAAKYEKTKFNLKHFFILNFKSFLNDTEHQNKLIYKFFLKFLMNKFMLLYLVVLWIKKTFYSLPKL